MHWQPNFSYLPPQLALHNRQTKGAAYHYSVADV